MSRRFIYKNPYERKRDRNIFDPIVSVRDLFTLKIYSVEWQINTNYCKTRRKIVVAILDSLKMLFVREMKTHN